MKTLITAALLGTVAICGAAYAQSAPIASTKPFKGDSNADGRISRAEFVAQAEATFARLDGDGDGALTVAERRAGHGGRRGAKRGPMAGVGGPLEPAPTGMAQDVPPPPPAGAMAGAGGGRGRGGMMRMDTDGNGKVTRAEFDAMSGKRFARMDANGDGKVDKTEAAAAPGGGRGGARADADGDGTLTRAEFDTGTGVQFARMDGNGDGVVDATELQAGPMGRDGGGKGGGKKRKMAPPTPTAPTGP